MRPGSVPLESIPGAFEGAVPSTISTCAPDGTPNISYLSIVRRIDAERIALTNQFLSKTVTNLRANPQVTIRVVDPADMAEYDLEGRFVHAETSGELFESVRVQLDAVAAQTGMAGTFRLRSLDVISVDACRRVGAPPTDASTTGSPATATAGAPAPRVEPSLALLRTFVRRLAACRDLAEAARTSLELLDDLFGFAHSMLLIADADTRRLFVIASNGYEAADVGAEIGMGEGLIGVAAARRETVRLPNMARTRTMAAAVSRNAAAPLPLRGLDDAQSLIASPVVLGDRLIGVLYLDSRTPGTFDCGAADLIDLVAAHLALTIALFEADGSTHAADEPPTVADVEPTTAAPPASTGASGAEAVRVSFHERDGSTFVDGEYLVRGVPGRILRRLLVEHVAHGRTQFSNKELRLDRSLELPAGADNLEARLLVLRRRLAERGGPIAVERVGRGRLELTVSSPIDLRVHPDPGA